MVKIVQTNNYMNNPIIAELAERLVPGLERLIQEEVDYDALEREKKE